MTQVKFMYRNHRNEIAERTVEPLALDYYHHPNNEYHHQPGWFLTAGDFSDGRQGLARSFELCNIQLSERRFVEHGNSRGPVFRIDLTGVEGKTHELENKIEALEMLRPVWAQGYSSDSVAAQSSTAALAQIWHALGVDNQTDAMARLNILLAQERRLANQHILAEF